MGEAAGLIGKTVTAGDGDSTLTGEVTGVTNGSSGPLLDVGARPWTSTPSNRSPTADEPNNNATTKTTTKRSNHMSVRSLGAAASGIETMQTDLDTIGNDIANSETDGFKSGTAEFEDLLTEQLQPAGAAVGNTVASTNPTSIGAGDEVSAISTNFSEGPVTQTGVSTDVAIEGNGFLVVSQNGQTVYTRDGDLQIDSNGNLATASGGLVLGWAAGQPTTSASGSAEHHPGIDRATGPDRQHQLGRQPVGRLDRPGQRHHHRLRRAG